MGYNIAVAGKGGTGKTSLTGLLINNLIQDKHIDKLLLVSDCSRRSIQAVARIRDLARIKIKCRRYILNCK